MSPKLQGVYTALITPFTSNGDICTETLTQNLHLQEQAGVDCVVLLGTTGEPATIDDSERDLLITTTVKHLKGKVPIMVGCGSPSTKKTIHMAQRAQDLGADSIQIIVPYLNKPMQEGLYLHFKAISQAISLPICVYNIPGRCSVNLEVATLKQIAELPNIAGVKECSGNFQQIMDIVEQICYKKPGFSLLSGDDPVVLPMMAVGAHGIMSVISNLVPRAMVKFVKAIQAGNMPLAQKLHYALKPLMQAVCIETNPIPIKYMMQLASLDSGHLRLPLTPCSKASQAHLARCFQVCQNIIKDESIVGAVV